jgi:hypothetical protein
MPMWCSSSDAPIHGHTQPHHRIVRIPPGESVVLNSAERAPYLLLIEILNDDLDFQPTKRNNKEILKKIVLKEDERKGTSSDLIPFTSTLSPRYQGKRHSEHDSELPPESASLRPSVPAMDLPSLPKSNDDEEIDLVEQLYGSDSALLSRTVDLSESIVLPPAPKNKELEMMAWSKSSSVPSTPAVDHVPPSARLPSLSATLSTAPATLQPVSVPEGDSNPMTATPSLLSLDEYSERMRTAAIMLAQLNTNLRELNSTHSQPGSNTQPPPSSASWFSGSKRSSDSENSTSALKAPPYAHSDHSIQRMKLQQSEAYAIRDRIMQEMLALEGQRMERMREGRESESVRLDASGSTKSAEDEGIIRRELNKVDPSAVVFSESWAAKKVSLGLSFCKIECANMVYYRVEFAIVLLMVI